MDPGVERSLAKWPDVPDVFGWLALDRRGNWLLRNPSSDTMERIGNAALNAFISRNYAHDERGRWYFQNGPQRVFASLAYAPLVARIEGGGFRDHCGFAIERDALEYLDSEGSVLVAGERGVALLDDRDLGAYVESRSGRVLAALSRVECGEVAARFGFIADPCAAT